MNRKATALDVAKRAGVSRSAVSLVLNGRGDGISALPHLVRLAPVLMMTYSREKIGRASCRERVL